jgi:hypothetical protein
MSEQEKKIEEPEEKKIEMASIFKKLGTKI